MNVWIRGRVTHLTVTKRKDNKQQMNTAHGLVSKLFVRTTLAACAGLYVCTGTSTQTIEYDGE